jgi:hypothetical protein
MDPKSGGHFWVRCAHRAEKWTRFSAPNDALFPNKVSIGWIPEVEPTFGSDAPSPTEPAAAGFFC